MYGHVVIINTNALQSSPAPPGSGGGSWPPGPPYQGPDYPPGGPSSSSATSKQKDQDKAPKPAQGPLSQKQVELLSPQNSELRKAGSISSLRDALLATTASATPSQQQYASYSSPGMGERQASPATPSTNLPMTPESTSVISPQISVTAATRQDSQLLCPGGQGVDQAPGNQGTPYSRQNSAALRAKDGRSQSTTEENSNRVNPLQVESILGIKSDHPVDSRTVGASQSSPPVGNSLRDAGGGEGSGSNVNSPHPQSPMGGMLAPSVAVGPQEGRSPRPDLLGFPARSPSFRDKQPSPLTEDGKTVSCQTLGKLRGEAAVLCPFLPSCRHGR